MVDQLDKHRGFTLVELLIVIAIIGIISTLVFVYLRQNRSKARDAARVVQLEALHKALELYYDDHGSYPTGNSNSWNTFGSYTLSWKDGLGVLLAQYLRNMPPHPSVCPPGSPMNCAYQYYGNNIVWSCLNNKLLTLNGGGRSYYILILLENWQSSTLSQNDGGRSAAYEILSGDYTMMPC